MKPYVWNDFVCFHTVWFVCGSCVLLDVCVFACAHKGDSNERSPGEDIDIT
jgi:hypothetical protein